MSQCEATLESSHACVRLWWSSERGAAITKDQREMIRQIEKLAMASGLTIRVNEARGKGGHIRVYVGGRATVIPTKVKTGLRHAVLKQLGLY